MADRTSAVEISQLHRTLSGFTSSYVGESAVIDLVDESSVCGIIEEVDG